MRIVHISCSVARSAGGPAELLRGLVPVERERGHEVVVVTTDQHARLDDDLVIDGAEMVVVPAVGPHWIGAGRGLRRAVRDAVQGADGVLIHGVYQFSSIWGMREARAAGVPYLVAPHGVWTDGHAPAHPLLSKVWDRVLLEPAMKGAHRYVGDSRVDAQHLHDRGLDPVASIVLGVDPALHAIDTPWERRTGVLFLGRVARKKRLDLTIRAYARSGLAERGHRLVVAGPIEQGLPYDPRELCASEGVTEHVDFVGVVNGAQRRELLTRMRVFMLPSDDESFGMAAAEAASAGMAVVASHHVAAWIEAEQDGVARTWDQDPDVLARALREAAADDAGAAAAVMTDYVRASWTWQHAAEQVEEMLAAEPAPTP
ncbi:glycosyltransferase [Demequina gelatinilytica]|uniref:glycosyltransferase n=1 Tax=Demequina gelatinilytica TaxID=1638980 RepID=UPI000784E47D|nr:glycosyltransferase [Demequina gelatinilytica]